MMNLSQTKLVGLTMELELKTKEYKKLCEQLEQLKQSNINSNDKQLLEIKELFQKNHDEIVEINRQIKEIKEIEETIEKEKLEKYNATNIFKRKNNNLSKNSEEKKIKLSIIETKKNIFEILIEKIKEIFSGKSK